MPDPISGWVVTREYLDGSGYEVLRVHLDETRAHQDLALVAGDHGLTYKVHVVPVFVEKEMLPKIADVLR